MNRAPIREPNLTRMSSVRGARWGLGFLAALGGSHHEAVVQTMPPVSYERPEDAGASAVVVHRLGEGPFARSKKEAFAHLGEAIDACMKSEHLPAALRPQLEAIARGPVNFNLFPVTGVAGNYMSPDESADCMTGRNKKGALVTIGKGDVIVRMQTDRVHDTKTGQIGYPAERRAGVVEINGTKALAVWTLPEECYNWTLKILYPETPAPTPSAPIPPPVPERAVCPVPQDTAWQSQEDNIHLGRGVVIRETVFGLTVFGDTEDSAVRKQVEEYARSHGFFDSHTFFYVKRVQADAGNPACPEKTIEVYCVRESGTWGKGGTARGPWASEKDGSPVRLTPENFDAYVQEHSIGNVAFPTGTPERNVTPVTQAPDDSPAAPDARAKRNITGSRIPQ